MKLRSWPWWKMWTRVKPLLNVANIEDELRVSILNYENAHALEGYLMTSGFPPCDILPLLPIGINSHEIPRIPGYHVLHS